MQTSKPVKSVWKYLAALAVMAVTVTGIVILTQLYPPAPELQVVAITQPSAEPDNAPGLIQPLAEDQCLPYLIYTSLPPKCKNIDGTFTQMEGMPSGIIKILPGK
jgi:hypothetical protein